MIQVHQPVILAFFSKTVFAASKLHPLRNNITIRAISANQVRYFQQTDFKMGVHNITS